MLFKFILVLSQMVSYYLYGLKNMLPPRYRSWQCKHGTFGGIFLSNSYKVSILCK